MDIERDREIELARPLKKIQTPTVSDGLSDYNTVITDLKVLWTGLATRDNVISVIEKCKSKIGLLRKYGLKQFWYATTALNRRPAPALPTQGSVKSLCDSFCNQLKQKMCRIYSPFTGLNPDFVNTTSEFSQRLDQPQSLN